MSFISTFIKKVQPNSICTLNNNENDLSDIVDYTYKIFCLPKTGTCFMAKNNFLILGQ